MGKSPGNSSSDKIINSDEQEVALAEQNHDSCLPKGQTGASKEKDGDNVEGTWCLQMKAKWLSLSLSSRLSSGCLKHTKLNALLCWFKLWRI